MKSTKSIILYAAILCIVSALHHNFNAKCSPTDRQIKRYVKKRSVENLLECLNYDSNYGFVEQGADHRCIEALLKIKTEAFPVLVRIIERRNEPFSDSYKLDYIALALGRMKDKRAVEPLLDIVRKESVPLLDIYRKDLIKAAVWGLAEIGDKSAGEPLIEALDKYDVDINLYIMYALSKIKDPRTVSHLISILESLIAREKFEKEEIEIKKKLESVLFNKEEKELESVFFNKEEKELENEIFKTKTIYALGMLKAKQATDILITYLGDRNLEAVEAAENSLIQIGKSCSMAAVHALKKDTLQYAWKLFSPPSETIAYIKKYELWSVKDRAAFVLARFNDVRAVKPLLQILLESPLCIVSQQSYIDISSIPETAILKDIITSDNPRIGMLRKPAIRKALKLLTEMDKAVLKRADVESLKTSFIHLVYSSEKFIDQTFAGAEESTPRIRLKSSQFRKYVAQEVIETMGWEQ